MKHIDLAAIRRRARQRLHHTSGAIDLFSIMVGVIIIGVISAGISATVFGVVPWTQDNAARSALEAVRTAEGASFVFSEPNKYRDLATLVSEDWIEASTKLAVGVGASGDCYAAVSRSDTGKRFWSDNTGPDIREFTGASTSVCLDLQGLGATLPVTGTTTPVVAGPMTFYNTQIVDAASDYYGPGFAASKTMQLSSPEIAQFTSLYGEPTYFTGQAKQDTNIKISNFTANDTLVPFYDMPVSTVQGTISTASLEFHTNGYATVNFKIAKRLFTPEMKAGSAGFKQYGGSLTFTDTTGRVNTVILRPGDAPPNATPGAWHANNAKSGIWTDIAYGNGAFVTVGSVTGYAVQKPELNHIMVSTNGTSWTETATPSVFWDGIAFGNGVFVAITRDSTQTNNVKYSTNGVDWTDTVVPEGVDPTGAAGPDMAWGNRKVAFQEGKFLIEGNGYVAKSLDGIAWTTHITGNWETAEYSSDGLQSYESNFTNGYDRIAAVGMVNGVKTWVVDAGNGDPSHVTVMDNGHGVAIVPAPSEAGAYGDHYVLTSTNGTNWVERFVPGAEGPYSGGSSSTVITYGGGTFVLAFETGNETGVVDGILYSSDGITWATSASAPNSVHFTEAIYTDGKFTAVGFDYTSAQSSIWTSVNGKDWVAVAATPGVTDGVWGGLAYGGGAYVVIPYNLAYKSPYYPAHDSGKVAFYKR